MSHDHSQHELTTSASGILLVLIGPLVFGADLLIRYALVQHACSTGHHYVLHVVSLLALIIMLAAFFYAWGQYVEVMHATDDGGSELDRSHFVLLLAVLMDLGCALLIIANAVPAFILNPCD